MLHAMIDLETLDVRPEAVVLSIGIALFNPNNPAEPPKPAYYGVLDKTTQIESGRTTSQSTVDWWAQQSPEARTVLAEVQRPVIGVLKDVAGKIDWNQIGGVWGNGASFDNAMLKSLFAQWTMDLPWDFWKDRCHRTVKAVFETRYCKSNFPREGTHHNALDDAMHQARELQHMLHHLGIKL